MAIDLDYLSHDRTDRLNNRNYKRIGDNPSEQLSEDRTNSAQDIDISSAKIDVTRPTAFSKIDFGAKASFTRINSDWDYSKKAAHSRSDFDSFAYRENTQALYLSLTQSAGKWRLKAGIRLEANQTQGKIQVLCANR